MPSGGQNFIDLTGQPFGCGVVRERTENRKDGSAQWIVDCKCGNPYLATTSNLRGGHANCCGRKCPFYENTGRFKDVHGKARTKLYASYNQAYNRCYNPKHKDYRNYGARGITMFPSWIPHKNYPKMELDRIDNDKGYVPGNLRWATHSQQQLNRRGSRITRP